MIKSLQSLDWCIAKNHESGEAKKKLVKWQLKAKDTFLPTKQALINLATDLVPRIFLLVLARFCYWP